jgi:hypothetical protein
LAEATIYTNTGTVFWQVGILRAFSILAEPYLKSHSEERSDERILLASERRSFRYAQDDVKKVLLEQSLLAGQGEMGYNWTENNGKIH